MSLSKNNQDTKSYLILGGAGFIGKNLCDKILKQGDYVLSLDNYITGFLENTDALQARYPLNFNFLNHDITRKIDIDIGSFDYVINLACPASPPKYQKYPIDTMLTSVMGTKNALDFAIECDAIFIQASTSEVYGDPNISPQHEMYRGNVNTVGIRACYDEGKRAAESLCYDYHRTYGLDVRVLRFFNTYGPFMDIDDGRLVTNTIKYLVKDWPFEVYGDGSQTRSFCYIDDLINGILKAIELKKFPKFTPINLGNPDEMSVKDLTKRICLLMGKDPEKYTSYKKLPSDDPLQRKPDISRAQKILNWTPIIKIDDGLSRTINHFKNSI